MTRIFGLIRWGLMTAAVSLATCLAVQALAQTFPERTVKLIVPVPPLLIGGVGTLAIGPSVKTPDCNPIAAFTPIGTVSPRPWCWW
jgi:hypothetical protein